MQRVVLVVVRDEGGQVMRKPVLRYPKLVLIQPLDEKACSTECIGYHDDLSDDPPYCAVFQTEEFLEETRENGRTFNARCPECIKYTETDRQQRLLGSLAKLAQSVVKHDPMKSSDLVNLAKREQGHYFDGNE